MPAPIIIDGPVRSTSFFFSNQRTELMESQKLWNDISAAAMYLVLGSSSSLASFQTFVEAGAPARVDNRTKVVLPEGEAPAVVTPTTWLTDVCILSSVEGAWLMERIQGDRSERGAYSYSSNPSRELSGSVDQ